MTTSNQPDSTADRKCGCVPFGSNLINTMGCPIHSSSDPSAVVPKGSGVVKITAIQDQ
jgi:hypothetical protein